MAKLIELPNGSWVAPDAVTSISLMEPQPSSDTPRAVLVADGRYFLFDCADPEEARALVARLANAVNEARDA